MSMIIFYDNYSAVNTRNAGLTRVKSRTPSIRPIVNAPAQERLLLRLPTIISDDCQNPRIAKNARISNIDLRKKKKKSNKTLIDIPKIACSLLYKYVTQVLSFGFYIGNSYRRAAYIDSGRHLSISLASRYLIFYQ